MPESRIYVGTSGYSYPQWKGTFYPEKLAATKFLEFYAQRVATVEINNSFYRFPGQKMLEEWRERTPPDFRFAVKANQRITHAGQLRDVGQVTQDFVERCSALGDKLGPILFQLPPTLKRDDERLGGFLAVLPRGARCALEFRHASWLDEQVLAMLSGAGVALAVSDGEKLTPPRLATANFCYVRLRRDDYDAAALTGWRGWFQEQAAAGHEVYAYLKHEDARSPEEFLRILQGQA
jgi:uncharacterized protein YecE (DUF72 family)